MSEFDRSLSTTPRLFVQAVLSAGAAITLDAPQSHYLGSVMRRQPGDMVRLFNGHDGEWAARVSAVAKKAVTLIAERQSAPQEQVPDLWLCAAPLKKGRIDWLVEKACELGVARLQLVTTQRTVVDKPNLERLSAHLVEAAEQSGRTAVPELPAPLSLAQLLKHWPADRALIFADETGGDAMAAAFARCPAPAAILIGPEGGFTSPERDAIRAHPGAVPVSLGPRILRADTAALAAVAVWQAINGH
ncbi:16S rRNA (uracil(1498)-N(3))-methyltransferase [Sandarakinorhabdus sp. AAP62]|uniref:16S rRNA (uracil(1498)-N(3))-methyltransferase n=1 Tax=Sandarakinorhabdus sp. AAP62 TaxID=1248916 RepID=UPI0002F3F254|nr:16S rRNA (uracil(1498)-N(3))-methyltransferase [Sandarakinorhabdus sp. AAP62]